MAESMSGTISKGWVNYAHSVRDSKQVLKFDDTVDSESVVTDKILPESSNRREAHSERQTEGGLGFKAKRLEAVGWWFIILD